MRFLTLIMGREGVSHPTTPEQRQSKTEQVVTWWVTNAMKLHLRSIINVRKRKSAYFYEFRVLKMVREMVKSY